MGFPSAVGGYIEVDVDYAVLLPCRFFIPPLRGLRKGFHVFVIVSLPALSAKLTVESSQVRPVSRGVVLRMYFFEPLGLGDGF